MKSKLVCSLLLILCCNYAGAQALIPMLFRPDDEPAKESDTVSFYSVRRDSTVLVSINDETLFYRLVARRDSRRVLAEGRLAAVGDSYVQVGLWRQYDLSGKLQIEGAYVNANPIGKWTWFGKSGKPAIEGNYGGVIDKDGLNTCLSGEYREYYPDGKLKLLGYYAADRTRILDTALVNDPVSGSEKSKMYYRSQYAPKKVGTWLQFDENGELQRKDDY